MQLKLWLTEKWESNHESNTQISKTWLIRWLFQTSIFNEETDFRCGCRSCGSAPPVASNSNLWKHILSFFKDVSYLMKMMVTWSCAKQLSHQTEMPVPAGPALVQLCIKACICGSPSATGFPQCVKQCGPHQSLLPPHGHCQAPGERKRGARGERDTEKLTSCLLRDGAYTSDFR